MCFGLSWNHTWWDLGPNTDTPFDSSDGCFAFGNYLLPMSLGHRSKTKTSPSASNKNHQWSMFVNEDAWALQPWNFLAKICRASKRLVFCPANFTVLVFFVLWWRFLFHERIYFAYRDVSCFLLVHSFLQCPRFQIDETLSSCTYSCIFVSWQMY